MKLVLAALLVLAGCATGGGYTPPPAPTYIARVSWQPVTELSDDSPATDITGYEVAFGKVGEEKTKRIAVGPMAEIELGAGEWAFQVRTLSVNHGESPYSDEVIKSFP